MKFITDSTDACILPSSTIGMKAFHLGQLERIGVAVPRWCVLAAHALDERLHSESTAGFETNQGQRTCAIKNRLHMSADDLAELRFWIEQRQREGHHRFIVRSSVANEESRDASLLSQTESFPNLLTMDGIQEAILRCVESSDIFEVSVILQVMVDADASGVLFTADPKDGSRRRFLISSNYGACESVVSGQFECDEFLIDLEEKSIESKIAKKDSGLRFSAHSNEGLTKYSIPPHLQARPCIEEKDLASLIVLGKKLTAWAQTPLEIEWVQQGSKIWIVQMRPIANLGYDHSQAHQFVFNSAIVQESLSGLVLPLSFSFATEVNRELTRQTLKIVGLNKSTIENHIRQATPMLALIKGRVYYNLDSLHESFRLLPSFGFEKEAVARLLKAEKLTDGKNNSRSEANKNGRRIAQHLRYFVNLAESTFLINYHVNDFRNIFARLYENFDRADLSWMKTEEIFEAENKIFSELMRNWRAPVINDLHLIRATTGLRRLLSTLGAEEILPDLLAGEESESFLPTQNLLKLAEEIRKVPVLCASLTFDNGEFEREIHRFPKIKNQIEAYIEKYGDRVSGELKLEAETLRVSRGFLHQVLRVYIQDSNLGLAQLRARQLKVRKAAELRVQDLIRNRFHPLQQIVRTWRFKSLVRKFRKTTSRRESMLLDRSRAVGIARSIYLELGRRLVDQGKFRRARDIFFLTMGEVNDLFHGKFLFDDSSQLIHLRQQQYADWMTQAPESQIVASVPLPKTLTCLESGIEAFDDAVFQGIGCCPGIVDAEVVILSNPQAAKISELDLRGKILVAPYTDIGWTPLLLQCKALVVERASVASHAVSTARELGLATVVGVRGISQILKTGMQVRVDGKQGTIAITLPPSAFASPAPGKTRAETSHL